jgi:SAM-dependent methyltransferase
MSHTYEHNGGAHEQVAHEHQYPVLRPADPRIARQIHEALGDARSVANVGAGAAEYEPVDRWVLAIEPSENRITSGTKILTTPIRGHAEGLPIPSKSVDAAMACLTLHQWTDWRVGVHELRRVARKRVVVFTYDPTYADRFWLLRDYLPKLGHLHSRRFPPIEEQSVAIGEEVAVETVAIPHDCENGLLAAYWRRPRAYLDKHVRAGIPTFRLAGAARLLDGLDQLASDLKTGRWQQRNRELVALEQLDLGYRLLVTEL